MIPETAQMCRTSWKAGRGHLHARGTSELTQGGRSRPGEKNRKATRFPHRKDCERCTFARVTFSVAYAGKNARIKRYMELHHI